MGLPSIKETISSTGGVVELDSAATTVVNAETADATIPGLVLTSMATASTAFKPSTGDIKIADSRFTAPPVRDDKNPSQFLASFAKTTRTTGWESGV